MYNRPKLISRQTLLSQGGSNKKLIACSAIPKQRKLTEEDEVKSTTSAL